MITSRSCNGFELVLFPDFSKRNENKNTHIEIAIPQMLNDQFDFYRKIAAVYKIPNKNVNGKGCA